LEQQFFIEPLGKHIKITSAAQPLKAVDVINEAKEVYAEIIVYEYHGKPNQLWHVVNLDK